MRSPIKRKPAKCPQCRNTESVRRIQYGFPALPVNEDVYTLGGCVIFDDQPSFRCIECGWED